jgi:ubiquinone/menaquinone biosynthesis C-methylase UbiE
MLEFLLHRFNIPRPFDGMIIQRRESCRVCGSSEGTKIAETDFWDLQHAGIVKCITCGHIQLDPMLTPENTEKGCNAYFHYEAGHTNAHEAERNLIRNYRRGILFAHHLKRKGYAPVNILEFGPGSGYFARGIQAIFPDSQVTVVDIVDDVLNYNREVHGFKCIKGFPDNRSILKDRESDLIISRDILEHVTDISGVLENFSRLLKDQGLLHFITPNGHEDVWGHYVCWKITNQPSGLLINHVNYFDGNGLQELLKGKGFSPVEYYTFQLKTTIRGKGWSMKPKLATPVSVKMSADTVIRNEPAIKHESSSGEKKLPDKWILSTRWKWLTFLYCWYQHRQLVRISPRRNIGHEIHGLFIKNPDNH